MTDARLKLYKDKTHTKPIVEDPSEQHRAPAGPWMAPRSSDSPAARPRCRADADVAAPGRGAVVAVGAWPGPAAVPA